MKGYQWYSARKLEVVLIQIGDRNHSTITFVDYIRYNRLHGSPYGSRLANLPSPPVRLEQLTVRRVQPTEPVLRCAKNTSTAVQSSYPNSIRCFSRSKSKDEKRFCSSIVSFHKTVRVSWVVAQNARISIQCIPNND